LGKTPNVAAQLKTLSCAPPKLPLVSMMNRLRILTLLPLFLALAACDMVVLNPSGDVAVQQRDLLVMSTWLMLLIIVPVMALTVLFAWRYRHTNREARYEPDWHHSMRLELVIWSAPLLIIICLGALTWLGTHLLDPYRPIDRLAPGREVPADAKALQVNVVALDWKWLFIYPEYGIATVNEMAVPVNRPVALKITASSVMNSLYIPEFAGMVYAMPAMETKLHGVLNHTGESEGFSSNYSGAGFSGMRFKVRSLEQGDFDQWVADARSRQETLTRDAYLQLAKPSEREPVRYFSSVDTQLYSAILGLCVEPGKMCAHEMMHGHGSEQASSPPPARVDRAPLKGAGLPNPSPKSADPLFVDAK
jgi:cytochrome o ubiquinol oxidase subunit 2